MTQRITRPDPPHGVGPAAVLYQLVLPYAAPPPSLRANYRARHWGPKAAATRQLRRDVDALGRQAGLHRLLNVGHVVVRLSWAPGDRRRRDAGNLAPMQKVIVDGLARGRKDWIGLDIVPDDTPRHVTELMPIIVPPPARGMWVDVWVMP